MTSNNTVDQMLDQYNQNKSKTIKDTQVTHPDAIDALEKGPPCPEVVIANISQDHWRGCKRGPGGFSKDKQENRTWTAVKGDQPDLKKGSVLIVRRTNQKSDGSTGEDESGVMGIWVFNKIKPVESNEEHPWNDEYYWYLYCESLETGKKVMYDENWNRIGIKPEGMNGKGIMRIPLSRQIRYLGELINESQFTGQTKDYLQSLVDCKK